jgi:hypothetical protein
VHVSLDREHVGGALVAGKIDVRQYVPIVACTRLDPQSTRPSPTPGFIAFSTSSPRRIASSLFTASPASPGE